ncbi:MAG: HAMP domain-containing histidine kinase [Candidatus Saganbacteria bacterium]|nr:HAMP domain-containing histidine kinase [Candidatus Saganbacteria bacterium]
MSLSLTRYRGLRVAGYLFAFAFAAMAVVRLAALLQFPPHIEIEPDINVQLTTALTLALLVISLLFLKREHEQVVELQLLRDDMQRTIIHDLKNPLATVALAVDLLQSGTLGNLSAEQRTSVNDAWLSAKRLAVLVNNLNDINTIEDAGFKLRRSSFPAGELMKELSWMYDYAKRNGKALRITGETVTVVADRGLLARVLENLVSNAIKYAQRESEIILSVSSAAGGARFEVADRGPGISRENRARLFKKYSRLENTGSRPGAGLGLYFCKLAVELHGGRIGVESKPGHGARFFFTLPA